MKTIEDLIREGSPQVVLNVSLEQLRELGRTIANELKEELITREPKLYTRSELKEKLGICDSTLWNYEKHGLINGKKIGNRKYFSESEVERLMK